MESPAKSPEHPERETETLDINILDHDINVDFGEKISRSRKQHFRSAPKTR